MLDLILSRRFQTAIAALLFAVLSFFIPELEGHESEFIAIVLTLFGGLLVSYTADHVTHNLGVGKAEAQNTQVIQIQEPSAQALPVVDKNYASVEKQLIEISYRLKALEAYGLDTSVVTGSKSDIDRPLANKAAAADDGDHA